MKGTYYLLILVLFSLVSCKDINKNSNLIREDIITYDDLIKKGYYFYPSNFQTVISKNNNEKKDKKLNGYFSNVKPSKENENVPTSIFTKDYKYFVEDLNGKYEFFYINNGNVTLSIVHIVNENTEDNKLESVEDIYNYLKGKNISYKVLKEKQGLNNTPNTEILLTKNSLFCKAEASKLGFTCNIYSSIKDTLGSIQYGNITPFYR